MKIYNHKLHFSLRLSICIITIALLSCNDEFLQVEPETFLNENSFFESATQIEQAVNGSYVPLRSLTNVEYWVFGEMRSDNTTFQFLASDRGYENRGLVDYFLTQASHDRSMGGLWNQSYNGIGRCNVVLANLQNFDGEIDINLKNQFEGEVKFLRAFYYYNLVLQFGGVPLELLPTESPNQASSEGRASSQEVFSSITSDLLDAQDLLPSSYDAINQGRATSGAAKTLLAKSYMMQGKYGEAIPVLRSITGYSILTGNDSSYSDVFNPVNKGNSEIIFAVQYLGSENGQGSNFMYQFAPNNSGNSVTGDPQVPTLGSTSGWNTPTQDMIEAYEDGDIRKDFSLKVGFTDVDGNFISQPYVTKYNFGFDLAGSTSVNFPTLRYADVLLMLAECLNEEAYHADGEAFDLVNQIRNRAGLTDLTSADAPTQDSMRNAILQERRVELAFENHRWYDLLRQDNIVEIMNSHGLEEIENRGSIMPAGAFQVTENKLLLPIPQRAITLDNLQQNPQ